MSCTYHDRNETMLAYVRQELTPEAQEAFEEHYFVCEDCASEVLFYEKTTLAMRGLGGIVFARPKRSHEFLASAQYLFNRWRRNFALVWEEGGTVKALAGYVLLIVFLSSGSLFLLKYMTPTSVKHMLESDSSLAPAHTVTQSITHLDWPPNLPTTDDPELQIELNAIQQLYQTQRNYPAVAAALERVINSTPDINQDLKIFLAVAWAKQNRKAEAKALLETLPSPLSPAAQKLWQALR